MPADTMQNFQDLIDGFAAAEKLSVGHTMLADALKSHGLDHVAYAAINLPSKDGPRSLTSTAYSAEWQKHYLQNGYVNVDPVVRAGLGGMLPIDWADIDRKDPLVRRFFGEAQEFKVGSQGISIPIRGRHHEFAMFSVTTQLSEREWAGLKRTMMRDLMLVGYHFHSWALKAEGIDSTSGPASLSPREVECLRWRALGKSDWDTSVIVGISERTVKFHLENARAKLDAMNTTHAISKAVSLNIISIV